MVQKLAKSASATDSCQDLLAFYPAFPGRVSEPLKFRNFIPASLTSIPHVVGYPVKLGQLRGTLTFNNHIIHAHAYIPISLL
jgi:hypothetical protein